MIGDNGLSPTLPFMNAVGILLIIAAVLLELIGLVVGFSKSIGIGIIAFFFPPYAWWLGIEFIFKL